MIKNNMVIGISGAATCGKSTFFNLFNKFYPNSKKFSLAFELKKELNPFFLQTYNLDIFNCTSEEKELLRPILVAHGKIHRINSNGRHWINLLEPKIREYHRENPTGIAIIDDARYDEFPNDEISWLKYELKGILVHINRYDNHPIPPLDLNGNLMFKDNRVSIKPANREEEINDPKVQKKADYKIEWPTVLPNSNNDSLDSLNIFIEEFIKWLKR